LRSGESGGATAEAGCDEEAVGEAGECGFGRALALSADGTTALIGAPRVNEGRGAAWVFTRSPGSSVWTHSETLSGGGEVTREAHFGRSVALSSDGLVALAGAPRDASGHGTAWGFTRASSADAFGSPSRLTGAGEAGEGFFGGAVALSADGTTALIGAPGDHGAAGAAWVYARSGSSWLDQGVVLRGEGEVGQGHFAGSVALAADGQSALIAGRGDSGGVGAAWPFAKTAGGWVEQGPKLLAAGEEGSGELGAGVALSGDGNLALIGAPRDSSSNGAVWRFTRSDGAWAQGGEKFTSGEPVAKSWFGASVALSADGAELLIGSPHDGGRIGSAWTLLPPQPGSGSGGKEPGAGAGGTDVGQQTGAAGQTSTSGVLGFAAGAASSACNVSLRSKRLAVTARRVALRLLRTGSGSCRGKVTLNYRVRLSGHRFKLKALGAAGFSIAPGGSQVVKIKLNAAGRTLFAAGHGKLNASLAILRIAPAPALGRTASVRLSTKKTPAPKA